MDGFKLYSASLVKTLFTRRTGEIKFGEQVQFLSHFDQLESSPAKYVLFGIPEDIGVRANNGIPGASKAWNSCLNALLNIQANQFTNPKNLIVLGEVNCQEFMEKAANLVEEDPIYHQKLGDYVSKLDEIVSRVIEKIVAAGKIPIVIGGGHNNAFGNIKGASLALQHPINIVNIDAHTDLRATDFRHSGNGFSYARLENYLGKYRMFGIHKNYTPQYIFNKIESSTIDQYRLFEHLTIQSSREILEAFRNELGFVSSEAFGLELDCDAISNFPSSAQSPSGFTFNMIRNFISIASQEKNITYLHICEAAPTTASKTDVGKALSYLITDFIHESI